MSKLREVTYDCEEVFPEGYEFPSGVEEAAERLTVEELEWLLIELQCAVECSHHLYNSPPQELYNRAGKELVDFLANYYDHETGQLWMKGN